MIYDIELIWYTISPVQLYISFFPSSNPHAQWNSGHSSCSLHTDHLTVINLPELSHVHPLPQSHWHSSMSTVVTCNDLCARQTRDCVSSARIITWSAHLTYLSVPRGAIVDVARRNYSSVSEHNSLTPSLLACVWGSVWGDLYTFTHLVNSYVASLLHLRASKAVTDVSCL